MIDWVVVIGRLLPILWGLAALAVVLILIGLALLQIQNGLGTHISWVQKYVPWAFGIAPIVFALPVILWTVRCTLET